MKEIKKIIDYMQKHPVCGFNLVNVIEDDFGEEGVMKTMLEYQKEGEGHMVASLFAEEYDGHPLYQTFVPQYGAINENTIMNVLFLIAEIKDIETGSFQIDVDNHRVFGVDGYSIFVYSDGENTSTVHEQKLISAIVWLPVVIAVLSQNGSWGKDNKEVRKHE